MFTKTNFIPEPTDDLVNALNMSKIFTDVVDNQFDNVTSLPTDPLVSDAGRKFNICAHETYTVQEIQEIQKVWREQWVEQISEHIQITEVPGTDEHGFVTNPNKLGELATQSMSKEGKTPITPHMAKAIMNMTFLPHPTSKQGQEQRGSVRLRSSLARAAGT